MSYIEKKALALWAPGVPAEVNLHNFSILGTAFLEMRERHRTAAEVAFSSRVAELEAALQQAKTELLDLHSSLHDDLDAAFTRINLARMRARAKAAAEGEQP